MRDSRIRKTSRVLFLMFLCAVGLTLIFSCEETTGPQKTTQQQTNKLLIYTDQSSIPANGGSALITVKVYANDDTTSVVSGVKVSFTANQAGTNLYIQVQNDVTDANGYARAAIYAGTRPGTAAVTASLSNFSNSIFLTITPGAGLISASPSSILADGLSKSTIAAAVIDSIGQPLPGAQVSFSASDGTITPQSYSDENGIARAYLTSKASSTDINATVNASTSAGKIAKVVPAAREEGTSDEIFAESESLTEIVPAAKTASTEVAIGTTTVVFRGITITAAFEKSSVLANNADSTNVTFTVKETTSGVPVTGSNLTLTSTVGEFRTKQIITGDAGTAQAVLFGGIVTGTSVVKATISDGLEYSGEVSIIKKLNMSLESSPSILSSNGTDISTIKAYLYDDDNNPIQNETIYFTTSIGMILPSAVTNDWGEATVNLRSARFNGIAMVTATYKSISNSTYVKFSGSRISVTGSPLVLVADGVSRAKVTASLTDASNSPMVDENVTITTSLGTVTSASGLSTGTSLVDSTSTEGKVTAYVSSNNDGDALVVFTSRGMSDSLTINFTNYTFSLVASDSSIPAGGATVKLVATLKDKDGTIIPITPDDVEFSSTLGVISAFTQKTDGTVEATLTSGSNAGPSTITASMKSPAVTSSTTVTYVAAAVGSIKLEASKNFVRIGGNTIEINARVFDITGNPKSGESVTFSIIEGPGGGEKIDNGTAISNSIGLASVSFVSGMTGSVQNGVAIQARAGSVADTTFVTITGQPESVVVGFDTKNFTQNPDGTYGVMVSAIVSDVNRNKVVDGTIVQYSILGTVGVIASEVATVDGVATTTLIYSPSDAGTSIFVIASAGGKQDKKELYLPGATGTVANIGVAKPGTPLHADGVTSGTITVSVTGVDGEPLNNLTVYSSADKGDIQPTAVTGDPSDPNSAPGKANIRFTTPPSKNDTTVTFTFLCGGVTQTDTLNLKGVTIIATADPEILPSDGQSKSKISVLIKETATHVPISGKEVLFGATDGYIGSSSYTDISGIAQTYFTSGYNSGTVRVMASYGAALVDTLLINISDVTARGIDLYANPTQIAANGISQSKITALLRDDNYNPVVGEVIRFTTTLGTITSIDTTDTSGRAEAILESERRNGQAIVTASFKEHVKTTPVDFTGVSLNVSATPENLFAGGGESTRVTALLKDAAEVPIVGENISFDWYLDDEKIETLQSATDVQGRASITLSSEHNGLAKIVVNGAGATDSTQVTFTRIQFSIDSDTESMPAGGSTMQILVQLYDTVNEQFIQGATVNFYTTKGTISTSSTTDASGKAYATLTSGTTAGVLTITASTMIDNSRVSTEKTLSFINAPPSIVQLSADPNIVSVGETNSTSLRAIVTDANGNPVASTLVSFKINKGPAGGERIYPPTATTSASGIATTYFYGGQIPSTFEGVEIQAEVGTIQSNVAELTIAGAPETIQPSYLTDWTLDTIDNKDGTYTLPISATALDINSNGVVDGTTVYFKIDPPEGAVLSPVTTSNSVASSTITYPSASAGKAVTLTASAGGKEGSIHFSLPGFSVMFMSVSAAPKTIPADGKSTTEIKATLFDKNGSSVNVPDGTTVSFTTSGGTLDPIIAKTVLGIATTTLTTDKQFGRYVSVEAQTGLISDLTLVYFEEVGSSVNQISDIEVNVYDLDGNDNSKIQADGIETAIVEATLKDFNGDVVSVPTVVSFETNIGQITNFVRSDSNGQAVATFSSGNVGTATISVSVGNVIGYGTIEVVPGPPQSVELSFSPTFVNVQG